MRLFLRRRDIQQRDEREGNQSPGTVHAPTQLSPSNKISEWPTENIGQRFLMLIRANVNLKARSDWTKTVCLKAGCSVPAPLPTHVVVRHGNWHGGSPRCPLTPCRVATDEVHINHVQIDEHFNTTMIPVPPPIESKMEKWDPRSRLNSTLNLSYHIAPL